MIVKHTNRTAILAKLRKKVEANIPILIASAGSGLVASLLEKAGADCVNTFSGARLRANGMGTMSMMWPILDSNRQTLDYTREDIMPAIKGDAFICACLNANDPLKDMRMVLNECKAMGVYSTSNIGPSISYVDKDSEIYKVLTKSGITLMEEAQPDIFCFHAGTTKGGLKGYDSGETLEQTAARTEEAYQILRKIKPDVLMIAHGAGLVYPKDGQYIIDNTSCDGIWTGSSTERIPIEKAVYAAAKEFADLRRKNK